MTRLFWVASVCAAVLSACASAGPARTHQPQGTLTGRVVTGPVCPVEQNPPDPACRPRPVRGAQVEVSSGGHTVAATDTDRSGRFAVELAYGSYVVTATNAGPLRTTAQQRVEIGARPASVRLLVDSGIR